MRLSSCSSNLVRVAESCAASVGSPRRAPASSSAPMAGPSLIRRSMLWNGTRAPPCPSRPPRRNGRPLGSDLELDVIRGNLVLAGDLSEGRFERDVVVGEARRRRALVRLSEDGRQRQPGTFIRQDAGPEVLPGLDLDPPALEARAALDSSAPLGCGAAGAH